MNEEYEKGHAEIWETDWIFYTVQSEADIYNQVPVVEFKVEGVVCKRIPLRFIMNEGMCYDRAISNLSITTLKTLQNDKESGLKKFKIIYKKFISKTN